MSDEESLDIDVPSSVRDRDIDLPLPARAPKRFPDGHLIPMHPYVPTGDGSCRDCPHPEGKT